MKKLIFTIIIVAIFAACNDTKTPQVIYNDDVSDTLTINNVLEDTTKVLVVGMPIYLDSTGVEQLIHPIGWDDIYKPKHNGRLGGSVGVDYPNFSKSKVEESNYSFSVNSNSKDYISGEMVNLIFENLETGKQKILTDRVLVINHVAYLKNLAAKIGKHYLLYTVYDKDYNRDGKLNYMDMPAYYMSNLDGSSFTKITKDYHYFDVSKLLLTNEKYYFRTLEDVNKDGLFNKKDKYHYYYIDLINGDFTPVEYFPLDLMPMK